MHGGRRGLLGIEPRGADEPLGQIVVEERLHRAGVRARSPPARCRAPGAAGRWRTAPARSPRSAAASPPGSGCCRCARPSRCAALVAVEPLAPGAVGAEAGQLARVVGGHLEEPGAGPVEHHGEQPAELVFDRRELAHQRASRPPPGGSGGPPAAARPRTGRSPRRRRWRCPGCAAGSRASGGTAAPARGRGRPRPAPPRAARAGAAPATTSRTRFLTLMRYLPRLRSRGSSFR